MDALVMCGGEGTRLDADCEKPLYEVDGTPMVDAVCDALGDSRIETTRAVVSSATPATEAHLSSREDVTVIAAPGDGYVSDLQFALEDVKLPVLTVAADLPLLDAGVVDDVLDRFERMADAESVTVCVPAALKESLGASVDTTIAGEARTLTPTGMNIVAAGDGDETVVSWDARLAVNVNRRADAEIAEELL